MGISELSINTVFFCLDYLLFVKCFYVSLSVVNSASVQQELRKKDLDPSGRCQYMSKRLVMCSLRFLLLLLQKI